MAELDGTGYGMDDEVQPLRRRRETRPPPLPCAVLLARREGQTIHVIGGAMLSACSDLEPDVALVSWTVGRNGGKYFEKSAPI